MKLTDNAKHILNQRYLLKDEKGEIIETPTQLFRRVAKTIAEIEYKYGKSKQEVKQLENEFYKMIANFDFMPNSPTLMNAGTSIGQLSACFVLPIEDSIPDIFETIKNTAIIHKSGGGTGFSFSRLRPRDDIVWSTGGVSSGPLSFMGAFNATTETIKQGGKRRGANMGILRVDHPDILDFISAKETEGTLNNFNLSVAITDEFMTALLNKGEYNLINPHTGKVLKKQKASIVWDLLCYMSWKNGEPAVIFIDTINKDNPTPEIGMMEATNPCVTGESLISTPYGDFPIKDLVGKEIEVYSKYTCMGNHDGKICIKKATKIRKTQSNAKVITIITKRGKITLTSDHYVLVRNKYTEYWLKACDLKPKMKIVGLRKTQASEKWTKIGFGKCKDLVREHRLIAEYFYGDLTKKDVHHKDNNPLNNIPSNLEVLSHNQHSTVTNNGHQDWGNRNELTGKFLNKASKKEKQYIPRKYGEVGLNWYIEKVIEESIPQDVYNMEVEDTHCFIANGMVVHNCGELPLLPYESCNLGSINLSNMLKKGNGLDWEKLRKQVRLGVRFLDNVIDANKFPLPQIKEMTEGNRKIGLGVMGWADALLVMGIRYDSQDALNLAEKVMKFIHDEGFKMSIELAKEKGNFPNKDKSIYKQLPYLRNATITTVAPTGTVSLIANCSSGIEPIFSLVTTRNVKDSMGKNFTEINAGVEKALQHKGLMTEALEKQWKESKCIDCLVMPKELRSSLVTAHEVPPECHVKMQAAFQKYTDNSISKTVNLPNEASIEEIKDIYIMAYKAKCKGITVYRDGSRNFQLLIKDVKEKANKIIDDVIPNLKSGESLVLVHNAV